MTKPSSSPLRTIAGTLLALLAFATARVESRAGCSHPAPPTPPGSASLDGLAGLGALAGEPALPPPSPCDGLRCSGDPAPASTPTITAVDHAERWGYLALDVLEPPPGSPHPIPSTASLRPSHGGPAPFHPPQA